MDNCKRAVETTKIASKQDLGEIGDWVAEIENKLAEADLVVNRLRNWRNEFEGNCERKAQEKELEFFTRREWNSNPNYKPLKQRKRNRRPISKTYAKLPKLEITKFNGTYQDWIRFWGQFEETIDKTGVPNVTKFSYLRQLLNAQVRRTVEALPFTSEGYNRAKSILKEIYVKNSEI